MRRSAGDIPYSFSPDGKHISFQSTRDGNYQIYKMKSDRTAETRLTHDSSVDDAFSAWSPDGKKILSK